MTPAVFSSPLLLEPRLLEKPWGGRRIETVLRRPLPAGLRVGESWEVFDRDGASSRVRSGALAGRTLSDLCGGVRHPLLVKILDAAETLSVQVHPDPDAASRLGGEPKTECWFVLQAAPGARVHRGFRDGVARRDVEEALARGTVADLLHSFEVAAGDTVFVPAGSVHSIGAGVLLAEVSQNSDTTWRFFDWGRGRPLHVREALEGVRFAARGPDKVPSQVLEDDGPVERRLLVRCPHFAVESVAAMGTFTLEAEPSPRAVPPALHVLAGSGEIRPFRRGVAPLAFSPGDTLLLPPSEEAFEISPGASIVRALLVRA